MDGNELFITTHERLMRNMLRRFPRMSEFEAYDITKADAEEEAIREYFRAFHAYGLIVEGGSPCSK